MTLKQIEYFRKVCETKNISTAAEMLFVSRSVVSRTLTELEEEFGAVFFTRSRSGVTLTESGQMLLQLFENFTTSLDAVKDRIHQQPKEQRQPLRVGVTPTNAYCVYKNYLEDFQAAHPDVSLYVTEYGAFHVFQPLLAGELDVAFTPATPDKNTFDWIELYQNPVMLGVSEHDRKLGDKATIEDIIDLPLGYFSAPMPLERLLEASFAALGKKPNVMLRTSDQMLLCDLTRQGKLCSLLPLDMMSIWDGVRLVPLDFFSPSTNRAVWSRALMPSPTMESFLEFMKAQAVL